MPLWLTLTLILAPLAALGGVVRDRARLSRTILHLRSRNEKLGDEIWEVRAAVEARQRAEAASEAKSRFLATVSHEVRTPLNGILGVADLLAGTPLDPEQTAYVEALRTSGKALATLIDEVLDFSRIEAGRLELASEPFALTGLVESVVELLAPRAQDKGLEIASFVEPKLASTYLGDATRLRQVLMNLAGNAIKFTERGGVGLSVTAGPDGALRFAVADTGPGVPAAHRVSIFREFEQGDGSTTRRHGGTGLGLAISRRIVERMGGTLSLGDYPNGGSVFSFDVALALQPRADDPHETPTLAGRRVLIVGESPFQAPFLGRNLGSLGADIILTRSAEEARRLLAVGPAPDLLVVDCALGVEQTSLLARVAADGGVPRRLLLFSPYERRAFGQSLVAGLDGWLVKPIRAASLQAMLRDRPVSRPVALPAIRSIGKGAAPLRSLPRVLLAEDNEINRLVAVSFLGRLGAQVEHAADGEAALDLMLQALRGEIPAFDLVLMDVAMPKLDGVDASRRLRAAEQAAGAPPTRVIALTAHAFAEQRAQFLDAGMDDVLTKPVEFVELARILDPPSARRAAG